MGAAWGWLQHRRLLGGQEGAPATWTWHWCEADPACCLWFCCLCF